MEEEQIEVNFRLDENGRTIPQPQPQDVECVPVVAEDSSSSVVGDGDSTLTVKGLDYQAATVQTSLDREEDDDDTNTSVLNDLLLDCEIADCGLMPRTFWVPAKSSSKNEKNGFHPRCSLEQMALDVFEYHTASLNGAFDAETSGAEWWVQIRPSPEKTGRYAMHNCSSGNGNDSGDEDLLSKTGISFHWDKDEDLRLICGGNTYVHPHFSTVTYLTSIGAPTVAINYRVHNLSGDFIAPDKPEAFVSWPKQGKHLRFDGRFLHAAPPDFMEEGEFDRQCAIPDDDSNDAIITGSSEIERKNLVRRHRRVTFLVNVWLNYRPFNVNPFPDTMIDKMSGSKSRGSTSPMGLSFTSNSSKIKTLEATVQAHCCETSNKGSLMTERPEQEFQWPMGDFDSGEVVRMVIPLKQVRSVASTGGNVRIIWTSSSDATLVRATTTRHAEEEPPAKLRRI